MKRTGLLLLTGAIAALAILYAGAAAPTPVTSQTSSSEIEQLKKDVVNLRQRVEFLEQHLKGDLIPATTTDGKERPDVINPYPGVRQVPQGWRRGLFNGLPYYIVPIETKPPTASEAAQQTTPAPTPAPAQNPKP